MKLKFLLLVLISFLVQACKNKSNSAEKLDTYNSFLIQEATKRPCTFIGGKYNYFKDSIENVAKFLRPSSTVYDSINKLKINFHSWPTAYSCINNNFAVVEKEDKCLFLISLCDGNFKKVANRADSLILKSTQLEKDLNSLIKKGNLKDSNFFISNLFRSINWEPLNSTSIRKEFQGKDCSIVIGRALKMMSHKNYQYFRTKAPFGVYEFKILSNGLVDINILNNRNSRCYEI